MNTRNVAHIRNRLRRQRSTLEAVSAGFIIQGILVVTGVLTARALGPENRGFLALFFLFPLVIAQLGGLGLPIAATYFVAGQQASIRGVLRPIVRIGLVQAPLLLAIHAATILIVLGDEPREVRTAAWWTMPLTTSWLVSSTSLAILQGRRRFTHLLVLRPLWPALYMIGVLSLVVTGHDRLLPITAVWVTATVTAAIVAAGVVLREARREAAAAADANGREMVRFGVRGLLGAVSPVDAFQLDQALVGLVLSPVALGLYTAATAFTNFPRLIAQGLGTVAFPGIASRANDTASWRLMWRYFFAAVVLCGVGAGLIGLSASLLIPALFGADFTGAVETARILLIGSFFFSVRRVLGDAARGYGLPSAASVAEIASWCWIVPGLFIATPRWGINGVAVVLAAGSAIGLVALLGLLLLHRPAAVRGNGRFRLTLPRPAIVVIGIALAAAIFGGGIASLRPEPNVIILVGLGVTLALPLLVRIAQRRFDPFEPIVVFAAAYGAMFLVRPAVTLSGGDLTYRTWSQVIDVRSTFTRMILLALLGAIAFVVGYFLPVGRPLGRRLHRPPSDFYDGTVTAGALAVGGMGVLLLSVFIIQTGGATLFSSFREQGKLQYYQASTGYLYSAGTLLIPSTLVLLAVGRVRGNMLRILLAIVPLGLFLVLVAPSGSRSSLLPLVTGLVVTYYLRRGNRPPALTTAGLILVALYVSTFILSVRNPALRTDHGIAELAVRPVTNPALLIQPLTRGGDTDMAMAFAAALQVIPDEFTYRYGGATIGDFVVRPIPRLVWPEKPLVPKQEVIRDVWPIEYATGTANPEFSVLFTFYWDLGMVGVVAGMLILGVVARTGYEYFLRHSTNPVAQLLLAVGLAFLVVGVRDSVVDTFIRAAFILLPIPVIFLFGHRRPSRQPLNPRSVSGPIRPVAALR